ncbi:putative ABC transporter permease [Intestinibacter sp.]
MLNLNPLRNYLILFLIGGIIYVLIEIAYRGYSHISMFIVGGICFVFMSSLNELPFKIPLILQMFISCLFITGIELISGVILNIFLHLNVWDYSLNKFNFLGQICLKASISWFFLSLPGIYMGNFLKSILAQ